MGVYLYPNNTETPLKNAYIGIPFPTSIVLDKSSINLTNIGDTSQLTATIEPTVSDKTITWTTSDPTVATVSSTGLVTCVTPGTCTITATTVNGLTASCGVTNNQGWQPGADTLLYLPMNTTDTYLDKSGNNVQTTNYSVSFETYQGVDCGKFNGTSSHIQITPFNIPSTITCLCWCYCTGYDQGDGKIFDARDGSRTLLISYSNNEKYHMHVGVDVIANAGLNQWLLVAGTSENGNQVMYAKGNGVNVSGTGTHSFSSFTPTYTNVGNEWNNGAPRHYAGGMSNLIVESRVRTAQEISDYFDLTKSLYGIS